MNNLSEREQRFGDLILPIRDLAINWDIDIAAHLEEYLDELESIKFSVKGDKSNLNFAEAALLIQGSTAVYCRKVEYLHNLVLQALELVSSKSSQKNKQQGPDAAAASAEQSIEEKLLIGNDPHFLILDDEDIPEGVKIDLEVDHENFDEARRMSKVSAVTSINKSSSPYCFNIYTNCRPECLTPGRSLALLWFSCTRFYRRTMEVRV